MSIRFHHDRRAQGLALRAGARQAACGRCSPCPGMSPGGGLRLRLQPATPRRGRDRFIHTF